MRVSFILIFALILLVTPAVSAADAETEGLISAFKADISVDSPSINFSTRSPAQAKKKNNKKRGSKGKRQNAPINTLERISGRLINTRVKASGPNNVNITCRAPSTVDSFLVLQAFSKSRVAVTSPSNVTRMGNRTNKGFKVNFPTGGIFRGENAPIKETINVSFSQNGAKISVKLVQNLQFGAKCKYTYQGQFFREIFN